MLKKANKISSAKPKRKAIKITIIVLAVIIAIPVLSFGVLRVVYPTILRATHAIKAPGIDLLETVEIGGINQVLYFRGENIENPVILFLHGGPGSSEITAIHGFQ